MVIAVVSSMVAVLLTVFCVWCWWKRQNRSATQPNVSDSADGCNSNSDSNSYPSHAPDANKRKVSPPPPAYPRDGVTRPPTLQLSAEMVYANNQSAPVSRVYSGNSVRLPMDDALNLNYREDPQGVVRRRSSGQTANM